MTGIGPVEVRVPRVRDRLGNDGDGIRFSSTIVPPYARRSKSLEVLIPVLYLKGISTGAANQSTITFLNRGAPELPSILITPAGTGTTGYMPSI